MSTTTEHQNKAYTWIFNWFSQWKHKPRKEIEITVSEPRPSITVSIASDRTQQTTSSWASDERRDSLDKWNKTRKFHWPHRHSPRTHELDFFRQKRQSISSTPSRPNSILSPPCSPHFTPYMTEEEMMDDPLLDEERKKKWKMNPDLTRLALDGLFSNKDMVTSLSFSAESHILQVGCGNAAWAIDVASQYPRWAVIGLDESNNRPLLPRNIPKNFRFIECVGILEGLKRIPSETFDMITCRFLLFSLPFEIYRQVMEECRRLLKPNRHLEFIELDLRIYYQRLLSMPTNTNKMNHALMEHLELDGLDPRLARKLQTLTTEDSLETKYISLPLGIWGGRLGVMFKDDLYDLMETILNDQQELDKELDLNRAFMNLHLLVIRS
ncbi:unnamed protein product [Rhizopus stolonifer]